MDSEVRMKRLYRLVNLYKKKCWKCRKLVTPGCSTLWNAAFSFSRPASVSFCRVWVVPSVIYTTVTFLRRTEGLFLRATGLLLCPAPAILPCGDKTMCLRCIQSCIHCTAPLFTHHTSSWKTQLPQVYYSYNILCIWSTLWSFCWQTFYFNLTSKWHVF